MIRVLFFFVFLLAAKVQSTKGTISGCGSINSDGVGILSRNIYSSMFCNEVCYFHLNNLPVISLCFYFTQHFSLLSCILAVDLFFVVVSAGYTPVCKLLFPKPNSLWKTGYFSLLLPSFFPPIFPPSPRRRFWLKTDAFIKHYRESETWACRPEDVTGTALAEREERDCWGCRRAGRKSFIYDCYNEIYF